MSVRRALVDCVVLSLQDSCVFYPSCSGCLSRIDVDQQNNARCRCSRCGSWCLLEQVTYRYRLSVRVARERSIFGITVFGSTLDPFFGIDATALHRLVQNTDGPVEPSAQVTLLLRAVKDCFIGRHFIFGIKLSEGEKGPWIDSSDSKDAVHYIASQMIPPTAGGLGGCTVVAYYRSLLQKASDDSPRSADLSRTSWFPAAPLLLAPHSSPASSFNASPSAFSLPLQSSQRAQDFECPLTFAPPWQQSPGIVTSSAEQDEGGDESSRRTDHSRPPHSAQGAGLESRTSLLPAEQSLSGSPSFGKSTNSSIVDFGGKSPILDPWVTPSRAGRAAASTGQLTSPLPFTSAAWEDFPFSESLTEFIFKPNKDFDFVRETEPNLSVCSKKETERKQVEMTNWTVGAPPAGHRTAEPEKSHSQISLGTIPAPAANGRDRQDLSKQVCKDMRSPRFHLQNDRKEEKDYERNSYNCSADLFNHSLISDTSTEMLDNQTPAVTTTSDQNHLRDENVNGPRSPRENQRGKSRALNTRNSLTLQAFNFAPSSQSTPIVKASVVSQSSARPHRQSAGEFSSQPDGKDSGVLREIVCERNGKPPADALTADQLPRRGRKRAKENRRRSTTPSRCVHKASAGRRLWKADRLGSPPSALQHLRVQRRKRSLGLTEMRDSGVCQLTFCDCDDGELPPAPAAKTQPSSLHQRGRQTESCSSRLAFTGKEQQEGGGAERQITASSSPGGDRAADDWAVEISEDRSDDRVLVDESRTCDWSKDLFSDSV